MPETEVIEEGWSTLELAGLSGATLRQLDRWATAGVFGAGNVTPGSGRHRRYDPDNVVVAGALRVLGVLLGADHGGGVNAELAVMVARAMRMDRDDWDGGRLVVVPGVAMVAAVVTPGEPIPGACVLIALDPLREGL